MYPKKHKEFEAFSKLEQEKYLFYLPILKERLNKIHNIDETELFWERVLGLTLLIHIAQCLFVFKSLKIGDKGKKAFLNVRNIKKYSIPWDEKEYRDVFINSSTGQSILKKLFYTKCIEKQYAQSVRRPAINQSEHKTLYDKILSQNLFILLKEVAIIIIQKVVSPVTIIIEAYWSIRKQQEIQIVSKGNVQFKKINFDDHLVQVYINTKNREVLSELSGVSDDFDKYFFSTLKYVVPTSLIERFSIRKNKAESMLSKYPMLQNIFNESMSPDALLLLALSEREKINSYYIEHNYLQYQFIGNNIWSTKRKFDYFLSLGWEDKSSPNHVPSSSNYNWKIESIKNNKNIEILYISGVAQKYFPHFSSGYGQSGERNANNYIDMKKKFLNSLHNKIIKKFYYKNYPKKRRKMLYEHPINIEFNKSIKNKVLLYDESDLSSSVKLISRAKICVCDYLGTAFNQILMSNTPTIILFNKNAYFLNKEHESVYDELINVKIFHTNPVEAAKFINNNFENIENWWSSKTVQNARNKYLRNNFGKDNHLDNYILNLHN